ncbi:MAG TPA: hypothetical protein VLJ76_08640 [Gaiellaceae bacterium]|nr:hypothetical protein [Gaiellaceae bacterium]
MTVGDGPTSREDTSVSACGAYAVQPDGRGNAGRGSVVTGTALVPSASAPRAIASRMT